MLHVESSQQIYFTTEYARFRMINGNRQLNDGKIKRIIREISEGNDMLRYYPIQVRESKDRLDILDGQHRFYICKHLKRPVFYILVQEEKSMPDIAKINSNVEKWKPDDFINCYVQHGNEHYVRLREFLEKYKISLSVALLLLKCGHPGTEGAYPGLTDEFRNGVFEVCHLQQATEIMQDCSLFNRFANHRSRAFIIAIHRIRKAGLVTMDELQKAYAKKPEMLTEQANYKSYVNTLEQILNVGKQKRIVII